MGIKYKINENFFKTWSRNSAYILGFFFADGSLEDASYIRGKYIRFSNTDRSLIERIKTSMVSSHKIVAIPAFGARKEKYLLRIGSHDIYHDLENLGLHPCKSLNMKFPRIPYRFLSDFVRGYFDGDGCMAFEKAHNKRHDRLKVIFTSGSKEFLRSLSDILKKRYLGRPGGVYCSHNSYQLLYSSVDALKILELMYAHVENRQLLYLDRKYNKYKNLMKNPDNYKCGNLFDKQSKIWH